MAELGGFLRFQRYISYMHGPIRGGYFGRQSPSQLRLIFDVGTIMMKVMNGQALDGTELESVTNHIKKSLQIVLQCLHVCHPCLLIYTLIPWPDL